MADQFVPLKQFKTFAVMQQESILMLTDLVRSLTSVLSQYGSQPPGAMDQALDEARQNSRESWEMLAKLRADTQDDISIEALFAGLKGPIQ